MSVCHSRAGGNPVFSDGSTAEAAEAAEGRREGGIEDQPNANNQQLPADYPLSTVKYASQANLKVHHGGTKTAESRLNRRRAKGPSTQRRMAVPRIQSSIANHQ